MVSEAKKIKRSINAKKSYNDLVSERRDKWKARALAAEMELRQVKALQKPASLLNLEKEVLKYKNLYTFHRCRNEARDKTENSLKERVSALRDELNRAKYRSRTLLYYFSPPDSDVVFAEEPF